MFFVSFLIFVVFLSKQFNKMCGLYTDRVNPCGFFRNRMRIISKNVPVHKGNFIVFILKFNVLNYIGKLSHLKSYLYL